MIIDHGIGVAEYLLLAISSENDRQPPTIWLNAIPEPLFLSALGSLRLVERAFIADKLPYTIPR